MSTPIVTSTGTGVVKNVYASEKREGWKGTEPSTWIVVITPDGSGEVMLYNSRTPSEERANFSAGDKVAFTLTDGPYGKLSSELRKTS